MAAARTWADGQATICRIVMEAKIEVARQGFQSFVASLGAQTHAKAAGINNEAERQFQEAIESQVVEYGNHYNRMLQFARGQEESPLRQGLEERLQESLNGFFQAVNEREQLFRECTKKRLAEAVLK